MTTIKNKFDLGKRESQVATATLDESDFMSRKDIEDGSIEPELDRAVRDYIGIEVSVKRKLSLETQFKLAELSQMQDTQDAGKAARAFKALAALLPEIITGWNLSRGGETLPITYETIMSFDDVTFAALQKTFSKATTMGRMSPNS